MAGQEASESSTKRVTRWLHTTLGSDVGAAAARASYLSLADNGLPSFLSLSATRLAPPLVLSLAAATRTGSFEHRHARTYAHTHLHTRH